MLYTLFLWERLILRPRLSRNWMFLFFSWFDPETFLENWHKRYQETLKRPFCVVAYQIPLTYIPLLFCFSDSENAVQALSNIGEVRHIHEVGVNVSMWSLDKSWKINAWKKTERRTASQQNSLIWLLRKYSLSRFHPETQTLYHTRFGSFKESC